MSHQLPDFAFHHTELHIDPVIYARQRYKQWHLTTHQNALLGTRIWWAETYHHEQRCLKEFFLADPAQYARNIPDPIWRCQHPPVRPSAQDRGLRYQRAIEYEANMNVPMDTGIIYAIGQDPLFRKHFNAYAFELESLLLQFAQHYGYSQIVRSHRWGSMVLNDDQGSRFVIEMERLEELQLPAVGDYLSITNRLIEMMSAVTQLHAMMIPVRCYPPELVRNLRQARETPITRPFHYDLSPDQFMRRPATPDGLEQVVLIDFNSSRMSHAEVDNFFWYSIPGKEYYQPLERSSLREYRNHNHHFQSSAVYDLYALLVMALFYFFRERDEQHKPGEISGWHDAPSFRRWLQSPNFSSQVAGKLATHRGIHLHPLLSLWAATLSSPSQERHRALQSLSFLGWPGTHDWMLVPRAMNALARLTLLREFYVRWSRSSLELTEGSDPIALSDLLQQDQCFWYPGRFERGRIDHPDLDLQQLCFIQTGDPYPIVRHGILEPTQAGEYEIFAVWRGCVDFDHPLRINIRPGVVLSRSSSMSPASSSPEAFVLSDLSPVTTTTPRMEYPEHTLVEQPGLSFIQHRDPLYQPYPAPGYTPASLHNLPPHITDPTFDAFWSQPPTPIQPVPSAVPAFTTDYPRERHVPSRPESAGSAQPEQGAVLFYTQAVPTPPQSTTPAVTPLPSGNLDAQAIEIPGIPHDEIASQLPWPVQLDANLHAPHPTDWLLLISECTQLEALQRLHQQMQHHFPAEIPLDHQVQLYAKYCELMLPSEPNPTDTSVLRAMIRLLDRSDISKLHTGILLNNLTVYCYQRAWEQRRLPDWQAFLGVDPLAQLRHWLQLSESSFPLAPAASPMQNLRVRCRETVKCALFIQRSTSSKLK